jgi:hypothetical protein
VTSFVERMRAVLYIVRVLEAEVLLLTEASAEMAVDVEGMMSMKRIEEVEALTSLSTLRSEVIVCALC